MKATILKILPKSGFALIPVAAMAVLIVSVLSAKAQLLAYEGFDYDPDTTIAGQSGGFGWATAWATGGGNVYGTNVSGSLSYTDMFGNTLATSGGSVVVGNWTLSAASNPNRSLANNLSMGTGTTPGPGATTWISFLAQRIGPSNSVQPYYDRQANLALFQGTSERMAVGRPNTNSFTGTPYDTWSLWHANGTANNGAAFAQPTIYPLNSPGGASFLLLRVDTDDTTGTDTAYLWVDWPNLLVEPGVSSATLTNTGLVNLSGVNVIRLHANGFSGALTNAIMQFDELRVGATFYDVSVVPEPSVLALATVGALILGARMRKKLTRQAHP